jgi:hypothetical protein
MGNQPGSERLGQGLLSPSPGLTVRLSATPQHPQPGRAVQGQELAMSDPAGPSFHRWNLEHGRDARRWRLATVRDVVFSVASQQILLSWRRLRKAASLG